MQSFDIYFRGQTLPDSNPDAVRDGVARLFKVQGNAVERLFSGEALRIKQAVDAETASRYRAAFREVGALVDIVTHDAPPPPVSPLATARTLQGAAAPRIDEPAPGVTFSLAEPGAIIDPRPPAPPAEIDTSRLQALPPNSGSLEDCWIDKPHPPLPAIDHLKLVDD